LGVEPGLVLDQFKRAATDRRAPGQAAAARPGSGNGPRVPIPALERILLNTLLSSEATCRQILPRLSREMTAGFVCHEVIDAFRQMAEAGPVSFAALDARLSEAGRTLLHDIAAADEIGDDTEGLAQAEACLRRLKANFQRGQLNELRNR